MRRLGIVKMTKVLRTLSLSVVLAAQLPMALAAIQMQLQPCKDKFQQDMKAAVLNGSITIPQLKELKENAEILKNYKATQTPGARRPDHALECGLKDEGRHGHGKTARSRHAGAGSAGDDAQ